MPFARPTLTELRTQARQDVAAQLPGADATLRFANRRIMADAQAGFANGHYGYLDWIAKMAVPWTALDEYLAAWAALKNVFIKGAKSAVGDVSFTGTPNTPLPAGTPLVRGDGVKYTVTVGGVVDNTNNVVVTAQANADPTGLTGAFGNTDIGAIMTLGSAIPGIQSNGTVTVAFTGGSDLETQDEFRSRMLQAFQNTPQGGAQSDYVTWALEVTGVTRAWCNPLGNGAGTVVVYTMWDDVEAAYNGFPQGTDGVSSQDPRAAPATGDQLTVANYIFPLRPAGALVYSVSPIPAAQNLSIKGISALNQPQVEAAISDVFLREGDPVGTGSGGTIDLAHIETAIAAVAGVNDFIIISPTADIVLTVGEIPVLGAVTWS